MLYFHPIEDFSSVNPYVIMSWEDFELDIPKTLNLKAKGLIDLTKFNVKTFATFTRGEELQGLDAAYGPVNNFLKTLSIKDQQEIALTFIAMHIEIILTNTNFEYDDKNILLIDHLDKLENKLQDLITTLDANINLCEKIDKYIKNSDIPIPEMKEAGTRRQDTPEMTFNKEEAIIITGICILNKLISPIISIFIDKYSNVLDNDFKEFHANTILIAIYHKRYKTIYEKLMAYVSQLISSKLKADDPTAKFNGYTQIRAINQTFNMLLVKRLVSQDLYRGDGNILKYIASCVRSSSETQYRLVPINKRANAIMVSSDLDNEEGNTSRLEVESKQSNKPGDIPMLARFIVNDLYDEMIANENLDKEILNNAIYHYSRTPIQINIISKYILANYFAPWLGGGKTVDLLDINSIIKLVVILQHIFILEGKFHLVHALSFNVSLNKRQTINDFQFLSSWRNSNEYSSLRKVMNNYGLSNWDNCLKDISQILMNNIITYNTPLVFWDMMELNSEEFIGNNKQIVNQSEVMAELLKFTRMIYERIDYTGDDKERKVV